jgi:glyoxylase-like metal-dependent hydrolase (beta-lactamase superfamily II)
MASVKLQGDFNMETHYFTSERVGRHTIRIEAPCGVCVYLVEGTGKAVLLDTAFGIGDLKSYVKTLTDKYLDVLLSHGHMDHAGGAAQFDSVYLNTKDWKLEKQHSEKEYRINHIAGCPGGMPAGIIPDDFLPARTEPYRPIMEGDIFDLGGVTVESVSVPGHTQGMLVFIIPEDRIAIFGDACGECTMLNLEESSPVSEYRRSLLHLQHYEPLYDIILRNHGTYVSPKNLLENNIELCNQILEGMDDAAPAELYGVPGCFARKNPIPGKSGNIFYDPKRK